jgi:hypothetical protein
MVFVREKYIYLYHESPKRVAWCWLSISNLLEALALTNMVLFILDAVVAYGDKSPLVFVP